MLPVFAFTAALVALPPVPIGGLRPLFWAIVVALPVGKLVGIAVGGSVALALARRGRPSVPVGDLLVVAALGGVGFTVSLLMNQLAFTDDPLLAAEGTLAVLLGSALAGVGGVIATVLRSRHYSRARGGTG